MSAEAISAALPRTFDYVRPAESSANALATDQLEETGLNQRVEATEGGEASQRQGEDTGAGLPVNEPYVRTKPARPAPISYPDASPSLPAPLVPIREVPQPDHVSESNPALEQLEERRQGDTKGPTDRLVNEASLLNADGIPHSALNGNTQENALEESLTSIADRVIGVKPEPTEEDRRTSAADKEDRRTSGADEEGRRASGVDHTLESVVLAQGRNASEHETTDSEFAGRLISVTS
jgi:hypothetical protein